MVIMVWLNYTSGARFLQHLPFSRRRRPVTSRLAL